MENFDVFFVTVMESFRDILGVEWTAEMDATWRRLIAAAQALLADA